MKQKAFFITFKGLSVAKKCLRPEKATLMMIITSKPAMKTKDFQKAGGFEECSKAKLLE